ncbi:hypothetical protein [Marinimicrobium alkaliphilum]|uniref:hypothetical protein n=1 Tax=Marinimicrobium alkaliphilum TaxID=2202654 RepID=UPI000DBA2648|nr:hypothetical protein [Marinimicrobium alkaliphilum]
MQIDDLTQRVNDKISELDETLEARRKALLASEDSDERQQLAADLDALIATRHKLLKSRDLARRAHELAQALPESPSLRRRRRLGLGLCIFSAVALVVLAVIAVAINR